MRLMHRTCPACHEKLTTNDHFFCGSCGSVLDSTLISNTGSTKKVIDLDKVTPQKNRPPHKKIVQAAKEVVEITNLQGIVILLAVLFFVGLPTYIFLSGIHTDLLRGLSLSKKRPAVVTTPQKQIVQQTSESAKPLPLVSTTLGNQPLISYVPYAVDVFVESGDLFNALKFLAVNDAYYKELWEVLTPVVTERFVGFVEIRNSEIHWAIVTPLRENFTETGLILPEKYKWISAKVADKNLIISNNKALLNISVDAASGLEKNINMNPTFVPLRPKITTNGKLSVVALTGEGKSMLSEQLPNEIPEYLRVLLKEQFKGTNSYLVVKD